jgi:sugar phosphate isomerase/epimerase
MKISFSTLACPNWTLAQVIEIAKASAYDGIELRFLENEDSLWKLPAFQGTGLGQSHRQVADAGLGVCCVDTSCRFDSPEPHERERWIAEGERMAQVAAGLGAPSIRVFGDRVQPGVDRRSTRAWIRDCLAALAEKIAPSGVQVWLETHGDFSTASEVQTIVSHCPAIGIVWDPASAFLEYGERPFENGMVLRDFIRHVHIKDLRRHKEGWLPVLTADGEFPFADIRAVLDKLNYNGFLSFEWEKKWHPTIEAPGIAVPHFAEWFRRNWASLAACEPTLSQEARS